MKIQTQFHLLIAGILAVPVLLILIQLMYRHSAAEQERLELAEYETIVANLYEELDEGISFENKGFLSRFLLRISKVGKIAVFRKDFQVIYSDIPEFAEGSPASGEIIFSFIEQNQDQNSYSFEAIGFRKTHGYILLKREPPKQSHAAFMMPFLFPVLIIIGLFVVVIIFAITMSLSIARSITKSVMVLENATRRIAAGELDLTIEAKGSNEITSLTNSLNVMRNSLKEEEQRRTRFIMGVTHDLKTPLALIKAYAEAIEDGILSDPANGTSATEIINAKADQLEGMINDLIGFVRMDTGEWRGQLKNVNISAFLRQSAKTFAIDTELFRREFRYNTALPEDIFVPMDERLVHRALENIVNNAIRYTPDGSVISFTDEIADNAIRITISDNGPGIDTADLPHVFKMFYRGTSSRREQGMGLGLAVAKWVADSHGWTISAASEKGQGACFTITIPLT